MAAALPTASRGRRGPEASCEKQTEPRQAQHMAIIIEDNESKSVLRMRAGVSAV